MSVAGSVALAAAERVERTAGPKAGLVAWRALAQNVATIEIRGKAILAGLRCAIALRDPAAIRDLAALWIGIDRGVWDVEITALCKELVKLRLMPSALELSLAEIRRHRSAHALYLYARCLDIMQDPRAPDAFRDAIERSTKEGARVLEIASRVRRTAWLARSWDTIGAAVDDARQIDLTKVSAVDRFVLARVLLFSSSRFVRAGALSVLDALSTGPDAGLAAKALVVCARFADDMAAVLTPLEVDRLAAVFSREAVLKAAPRAKEMFRAAIALVRAANEDATIAAMEAARAIEPTLAPLHARAHDVLRGRVEPVTATPSTAMATALLDVAVALRDGPPARAAAALRTLAEREERGERHPPRVLSLVEVALASEDAELRGVAGRLVAAMLASPRTIAPPRGFLALANALGMAGMEDLSGRARRAAALAKEPGAAESLATALTRSGWQLATSGDRARAIARLREAKALALGEASASTSAPAPTAGAIPSK